LTCLKNLSGSRDKPIASAIYCRCRSFYRHAVLFGSAVGNRWVQVVKEVKGPPKEGEQTKVCLRSDDSGNLPGSTMLIWVITYLSGQPGPQKMLQKKAALTTTDWLGLFFF